ncbi:MAG: IclR family transcriptional regulator [Proteobacteria bacterium]|nr:IclR family transcriptional regulator [Pseudomonadota bacterium]
MKIQSIERAITILNLFSYTRPRWGISEIATAMGLAKGTVHNIVSTLVDQGMLMQEFETRKYSLGARLFSLGTIMAGTLEINQKSLGPAKQLSATTGLICRLAIWDHDAALVTFEIAPNDAKSLLQQSGSRINAYCSAIGRSLLVYLKPDELEAYFDRIKLVPYTNRTIVNREDLLVELEESRNRGYTINNQEIEQNHMGIASTIFKSGGHLCAAISLTGTPERIMGSEFEELVSTLKLTAAEISRYMGHFP